MIRATRPGVRARPARGGRKVPHRANSRGAARPGPRTDRGGPPDPRDRAGFDLRSNRIQSLGGRGPARRPPGRPGRVPRLGRPAAAPATHRRAPWSRRRWDLPDPRPRPRPAAAPSRGRTPRADTQGAGPMPPPVRRRRGRRRARLPWRSPAQPSPTVRRAGCPLAPHRLAPAGPRQQRAAQPSPSPAAPGIPRHRRILHRARWSRNVAGRRGRARSPTPNPGSAALAWRVVDLAVCGRVPCCVSPPR